MDKKLKTILLLLFLSFFIIGCTTVSYESLSLRKTSIFNDLNTTPDIFKNNTKEPSKGDVFKRRYNDFPPIITHNIKPMLPIRER